MRQIPLLILGLALAGCGGPSIENSSDAANDRLNAASADIAEGSGRNADADMLAPRPGQRGLMPQPPPSGK